MPKHVVAAVGEIPPGERKIVEIAGRSIGVYNLGGEFFALRNRCPHQGGPLCLGKQSGFIQSTGPGEYEYSRKGEILKCPWHSWEFDIRTGQSWFDPARVRVRQYDVTIAPAAVLDRDAPAPGLEPGPYIAETYPVTVEQQYLVIDLPG
ncbi:MAG TPA: Rieske (2Fe-2S) protein [Thermomicrobiales bacterium]|jgi:3-phenylpropionate/trans-cinnamate dioxygenase ferredoxin subunit